MKIKYHDNTIEPQYVDGKLADNWNPDGDYGTKEYAGVHFRIKCPTYNGTIGGYGFSNEESKNAFTNEKLKVFESIGWTCSRPDNRGWCMEVTKGKADLYLHPQDFSGIVLKRDIKEIAEALQKNETFELRWVDVYDTVYDITDEDYDKYLETRRDDARKLLFAGSQTTRTNNYCWRDPLVDSVGKKIQLPRIGCRNIYDVNIGAKNFINKCIDEMIKEGYLIGGEKYIRSCNKTEMKKLKLKEL